MAQNSLFSSPRKFYFAKSFSNLNEVTFLDKLFNRNMHKFERNWATFEK